MSAQDWSRVVRKGRRKGTSRSNSISIEAVVTFYGGEVKKGVAAPVRCCMHSDSRRSAVMNTYENLYFCHTCGKGGTAVNVVMEIENLGFKDAYERAVEIAAGSGGEVRGKHNKRGTGISRRTWDI